MKKVSTVCLLVMGLFLGSILSVGATTIYNSEGDFLSAISGGLYYLEDFDGFSYGNPDGTVLSRDFGPVNGFSYTMSAVDGLWGVDGAISVDNPEISIEIAFTGVDVTAVGGFFWPTSYYGEDIVGDITLTLSDGTIFVAAGAGAGTFTGFTTEGAYFTSLSVASVGLGGQEQLGEYSTIDHLYVGASPVPIPSTLLLLGTGLGYLVGTGTRRKLKK